MIPKIFQNRRRLMIFQKPHRIFLFPADEPKQSNDWEKTNYNYPAQPPADDWGNTVANYKPKDNYEDFSDPYAPASNKPKVPDWGITQANINIPDD